MEAIRIIALTILVGTVYGFAHDKVVALAVCDAYLALGHPPLGQPASDTILLTGMAATWYLGLVFGILLALFATAGDRPTVKAPTIFPALAAVCGNMALASAIAGFAAYTLAENGGASLVGPTATRIPADQHPTYLAAYWAHRAATVVGCLGVGALCVWLWTRRDRLAELEGRQAR